MNQKHQYLALYIGTALILVVIITGGIATNKKQETLPASTLNLNPEPSRSISPTHTAELETIPFSWEEYTNDDYNFALIYPGKWYKQEYASKNSKGTFVAFSPDPLPCEDCTYVHDGYFSIKIYNQKSDPEAYAGFLQKIKAIGKIEGYRPIRLAGKPGVLFEKTLAAENDGWVYELTLEKETTTIDDSQIFKRVLSSFKFTTLVFTN